MRTQIRTSDFYKYLSTGIQPKIKHLDKIEVVLYNEKSDAPDSCWIGAILSDGTILDIPFDSYMSTTHLSDVSDDVHFTIDPKAVTTLVKAINKEFNRLDEEDTYESQQ